MLLHGLRIAICLALSALSVISAQEGPLAADWDYLRQQVEGRLYAATPYSEPCFSQGFDSPACKPILAGYYDGNRTDSPSAYIQTQWETCQTTNEQCLLDPTNPDSVKGQCSSGGIPHHYIDVRKPRDVAAAFKFSEKSKVPIVIKNTGHDYHGRSSAPGSLALWTHNLKELSFNPNFIPEGCQSTSTAAITLGAGVQWDAAYQFAEKNNVTVVGGSDKTVGVIGWIQGGGHGFLTPTMGLGVDRVLQYKVVTPDGEYRVVNECQNSDLFFALRGGGGGTFGVVMEATMMVSPQVKVQTVIVQFAANATLSRKLWTLLADNGLQWSNDGWGGISIANVGILVNPKLSKEDAAKSAAPLIEFGRRLEAEGVPGIKLTVVEFPSYYAFFQIFASQFTASKGISLALTSRLIPKANFETQKKRADYVDGLLAANTATPGVIVLLTAPSSAPASNKTSVTEAWRESLHHITLIAPWAWNATKEEKAQRYKDASVSIDNLRRQTPDASYLNEADIYEPNYKQAFWGTHYTELEQIKRKYNCLIVGTVWAGTQNHLVSNVIFNDLHTGLFYASFYRLTDYLIIPRGFGSGVAYQYIATSSDLKEYTDNWATITTKGHRGSITASVDHRLDRFKRNITAFNLPSWAE